MNYDVIGIGNAMVDVISPSSDTFLDQMGITKGIMQLIERDRAELLYASMDSRVEAPGGSVGNTIAGIGELGLQTAFIGKVKDDALGKFYAKSLEEAGTAFPLPPQDVEDPTSRSMIFVSPDGERSMNTYLGAGADICSADVPNVFGTGLLFLEGYLFDKDEGKTAFSEAATKMKAAGGRSVITISDPFCAERHRDDFKRLIAEDMDVAIGNDAEWMTLYETDDLDDALRQAAAVCDIVACTRSGEAVWVQQGDKRFTADVTPVTPVDATGAGDQFAAGFLFGVATGRPLDVAAQMGVLCAAEVIGHIGPRPEVNMADVFREKGLI
ncbi:Sugar or nucleoside kinase, ribokinase family [Octadecabacter temperatus]|uniref:Putative sugar kinase YdjH n=1 Tax=Octadecabacter temperatus TaxID=1458307 RepID=A0A0K0Y8I8_9RHOB|nr:adenosine kinase [Octadecabacter temperatus]AKS47278.1 putative sugar kinase YdjH [Octadecabacter temperatus]SIO44504.1 Sugar or nucleoside kinase, ribokinase family [Octadecabacter temperatus]